MVLKLFNQSTIDGCAYDGSISIGSIDSAAKMVKLLISLRPYNCYAFNSLLPTPKCTLTVEATMKCTSWPMKISPACPKPITMNQSMVALTMDPLIAQPD